MNNDQRKFYRLNYQITSPTLRLLDESGKQIGVVSKLEALQKAKEINADVVEIAPQANPPVAKLIDYKKFKYQEAKKEREIKKGQKNVDIKEIRLTPFMGTHDYEVRVNQAKEFLKGGNQVKISVIFKGRQITKKEFGFDLMNKCIRDLNVKKVVREPKLEGKRLTATVLGENK